MEQAERDVLAYTLAKNYLLDLKFPGVTSEVLDKYLHLSEIKPRPQSIAEIYERILLSVQNANMRASVIGGAIGGVEKLCVILCDFQPSAILVKYQNWEDILDDIEKYLKPIGKIRRTSRSIWPLFCRGIISAARFLSQFYAAEDFYQWVDFFDNDDRARAALPLLLQREISGFGFALACDFLKELGYINFAKPDVHLHDIFIALNLCSSYPDDYELFNAIIRVANNSNVSPYNADKLFWLIGSGYFYEDTQIGTKGRIGSQKAKFIAYARSILEKGRFGGE